MRPGRRLDSNDPQISQISTDLYRIFPETAQAGALGQSGLVNKPIDLF
jgi:hypothetical protein